MPPAAHLDAVILVCRAVLHHLVPKLDLLHMSHLASNCFRDALVDGLCGSHRELPGRVVIDVGAYCDADQGALRHIRGNALQVTLSLACIVSSGLTKRDIP